MTTFDLIRKEIRHRPGTFLAGVLFVAAAVLSVLGALGQLRQFDADTEALSAKMEENTSREMARLEDEIRKSMKGLGFNIFVFPEGQVMSEVYEQGFSARTMPEEYVERLARSSVVKVNHLLPQLTRRVKWEEVQRTVVLIGIRGEVPIAHADQKKPLIDPVPTGQIVIGHELSQSLGLKQGDQTRFLGREFRIQKTHPERGSVDDITVWMNLGEAQELLGQKGNISSILALECNCETVDRIAEVRAELLKILPGVTIIEKQSEALARAEARNTARATAEAELARVQADRAAMRQHRETLLGLLVPLLVVVAMFALAILTVLNVRARWGEIGILRAIGVRSWGILTVILGKAALMGLGGAVLGLTMVFAGPWKQYLSWGETLLVLLAAPFLAKVAGWLPALLASQRDPSTIIRHD
jgi:putative ABC transport system permease protein